MKETSHSTSESSQSDDKIRVERPCMKHVASHRNQTDSHQEIDQPKGLRQLAASILCSVRERKRMPYTDVATLMLEKSLSQRQLDPEHLKNFEKNIRRRVYDCLNVMFATGILEQIDRDIVWKGFDHFAEDIRSPTVVSACRDQINLLKEKAKQKESEVKKKTALLEALSRDSHLCGQLVASNRATLKAKTLNDSNSMAWPFFVLYTPSSADIKLEMTDDKAMIQFAIDKPFKLLRHTNIIEMIVNMKYV